MLSIIIFRLLSLAGVVTGVVDDPVAIATRPTIRERSEVETIAKPRVAQVRLAETLATADFIHSVSARGHAITFAITRGDRSFNVVATTSKRNDVVSLTIAESVSSDNELGGLSWLSEELESVAAVTRLVPDEDGAVTIVTNDNRRYMAIPGRGSGGNAAVEARWGAEWND